MLAFHITALFSSSISYFLFERLLRKAKSAHSAPKGKCSSPKKALFAFVGEGYFPEGACRRS
jgi:hypothetical protein